MRITLDNDVAREVEQTLREAGYIDIANKFATITRDDEQFAVRTAAYRSAAKRLCHRRTVKVEVDADADVIFMSDYSGAYVGCVTWIPDESLTTEDWNPKK